MGAVCRRGAPARTARQVAPPGHDRPGHPLARYLLEHEGERREKLLGIDDEIYSDKKVAKKWYKRIAQIVHPDFDARDSEQAKEAFQKLQDIYQDLTEDEAFGGVDE